MRVSKNIRPMNRFQWLAVLVCASVGCGDPINQVAGPSVPPTDVQLASIRSTDRYEWPLTRNSYLVAKPPQMAYVTSFPKKFSVPDPLEAELVPWDNEGLDESIREFLRIGYDPPSPELKPTVELSPSEFHGDQAFDVSNDGTRLVTIDDKGLALHRTEDGKLIGHMKLPSEISSSPSLPTAVRFAGDTKDMLVASAERIVRISGKDGSVMAEVKGCGEPLAQWDVTADDKTMLIRGESGRLFGGDPQLEHFKAYSLGRNANFDVASLSMDGSRIGVVVNDHAKTYTQDDFSIVGESTYETVTLDSVSVSIALGTSSDAWADGDGIFYTTPREDGGRDTGVFHMLWKPLQLSATNAGGGVSSYVVVGSRFANGKEQLVLFSFGPIGRENSVPHPLDEMPSRMACDSKGEVIAIADSQGLRVVRREAWVTIGMSFPEGWIYGLVDQAKFDDIENMLRIIKSQSRLAYGLTSEQMRSGVIDAIATRWRWLDQNDRKGDNYKRLEEWRKEGSMLAVLCSALRHYKRGWNARGGGTSETVTQNGWNEYRKRIALSLKELDEVFELDSKPPLSAFDARVKIGTATGKISEMDPFCRRAMALYPGEEEPHEAVAFKMLPQWFGEPGDFVSFVLSVSKMMKGAESDLLYVRLLSGAVKNVQRSRAEWNSYDRDKLLRGVEEAVRQKTGARYELWNAWLNFTQTRDPEAADRVVELMMEINACAPYYMDQNAQDIHETAERIRGR